MGWGEEEEERVFRERRRLENEENLRSKETSWQLMHECQRQIKENSNMWRNREMEQFEEKQKLDRLERAREKQMKVNMMEEVKVKKRKIDDLMTKLPMDERKRFEVEERKKER